MTETDNGLDAEDARLHPGDEFLRLNYTTRDAIDLGAELGAEHARKPIQQGVRNAIIIALLLVAWADPRRWTAYSRDKNWYAGVKHYYGQLGSYAATMWAVDTLEAADLIDHQKTRPGANARTRSRCRASKKLLDHTPITHINQLQRVIVEPLRLKDSTKHLCGYRETEQTRAWRSDVEAQNQAIRSLPIEFETPGWTMNQHGLLFNGAHTLNPASKQYYRVFNVDWYHGGRWYGVFWQGLSGHDRGCLLIDGQRVVEIDYPHLHPTLLAAGCGVDLGAEDPYLVDGFPRNDVKRAFNVLLNANGANAAVSALQAVFRDAGVNGPRAYALRLIRVVKQRHSSFSRLWATGVGLRLQCIDGDMCANVQRIMRDAGHPVLSVHDSFIIQASQKDRLEGAMDEALARVKWQLAQGQINLL